MLVLYKHKWYADRKADPSEESVRIVRTAGKLIASAVHDLKLCTDHILDLVITSSDSSLAPSLSVTHCSPSDHFPIFTKLSVDRTPLPPPTFHSFRRLHSIDINFFLSDLQCSRLITNPPNSLGSLLIAYNTTLSILLDKHAPVITIFSSRKSKSNPWFTSTLRATKSSVRRAENIWKRTHSALD